MFKIQGWVEQGNTTITTGGLSSSNVAQGSFPGCTVTVYLHGVTPALLATLYSDDNTIPTPLANPFVANADGSFGIYAVTGRYDIVFSGGDLSAPFTIFDVTNGAGGGSGDVVGPAIAVDSDIALFDGVTGKLLKDSGLTISQILAQVSIPSLANGRLTLAAGFPVYAPQPATPSSTNTGTEVVTFAADPGWVTGTLLTPASTLAGLTTGTRYYFGRLSSVTGAFYTTLVDANADTNRVNLSASVTQQLIPSGIQQTSLKYSPYNGDQISLWTGSAWVARTFVETSIPLGTLTNDQGYDVFCFNNAGTPAFELLAWTSKSARATAITLQNGIPVKTGDATRRLVGSFLTDSTTTTIDDAGGIASQVGGKRYVSNADNPVRFPLRQFDGTASYTYHIVTWRQQQGVAGNKVEVFTCLPRSFSATYTCTGVSSATNVGLNTGVNIDSITAQPYTTGTLVGTSVFGVMTNTYETVVLAGYHFAAGMECATNTNATATYEGRSSIIQTGLTAAMQF